jgi:undecaprenyl-diphosphatase
VTVFQALVLGVIQGLTEFLPVSSSAHLALTPWVLGWPAPGLAFDVSLHLGTLLAVLWYFRGDWRELGHAAWSAARAGRIETESQRRLLYLVIATIPGGIAGLLLNDLAESSFRAPPLIATLIILMGLVLWLVDRAARQDRSIAGMGRSDAALIGLSQVIALLPGVSRSGATITSGLALGFDRSSAARFSFLMSMPITAAAVVFKLPDAVRESASTIPLIMGIAASALSGWLAISVLLRYVSRHDYRIFALYRLALGSAVLLLVAARA